MEVDEPLDMTSKLRFAPTLFLACSLTLSLLAAPASVGAGEGLPELAGKTSIATPQTAGAVVRIPQPARISAREFENPDVLLRGKGRVAALALVKEPVSAESPQWIATRWPWCSADGCSPRRRTFVQTLHWDPERFDGESLVLPAGRYRIYLLSSERAVTATLRLHGLTGKTSLHLARPSFGHVGSSSYSGPALDNGEARVDIDQQQLPADGIYMFSAAVDSADGNHGEYVLTECLAEPGAAYPALPGSCTTHEGVDLGGPRLRDEVWSYRSRPPGSYSAVASFERVGTVPPPRTVRFAWAWLAYE